MRLPRLLVAIGKGLLKGAGNALGFGLGDVVEGVAQEVWGEINDELSEAERRAEMQALARMAADEVRQQVEAVVQRVAAEKPAEVQQQLSNYLGQVPELMRESFRRPEDQRGQSVPPQFHLQQASDLVPFLSFRPTSTAGPKVTLEFTKGDKAGQLIVCGKPTVLLFGRNKDDCEPCFPYENHKSVSKHHCIVECNPPTIRIRDLGSKTGTFVNGELLGKRPEGSDPDPKHTSKERELQDGDEVRLTKSGQVAFHVCVSVPPTPIRKANAGQTCSWCQAPVDDSPARQGLVVCATCRGNMQAMMHEMMANAQQGKSELRAVREYTLVEEIGHGGMGVVYLARHTKTEQPVAIKMMLPEVAADERAVDLFQREVRNTMALQHRHIVKFLEHGYSQGAFFMILEYCNGGSVSDLMKQQGGTLPVDEAVEITLQALEGLAYAHSAEVPSVKQKGGGYGPGKGLIHRDLKPANLFLTGWGSGRIVKVGDFGLAKAFDEAGLTGGTRTGECAGTWEFMSRQQVSSYKAPSATVDVWAMAASLYYMLTGSLPRDFSDKKDPWLVVLESDAVPIRERKADLSPRLADVIDEALKEPKSNIDSAADFKEVLENAV